MNKNNEIEEEEKKKTSSEEKLIKSVEASINNASQKVSKIKRSIGDNKQIKQ